MICYQFVGGWLTIFYAFERVYALTVEHDGW